jgi:nucleoid DNA-binding protein
LIDSVRETIKTTLANGEDLLISGFGKLIAIKREPDEEGIPRAGST